MNLVAALQAFFTTEVGLAVQAVAVLAAADFLTGVFASVKDGTFQWDAVAAWTRKHLAGRVLPIFALAFLGHFGDQVALLAIAGVAAAAYVAETVASIRGNLIPPKSDPAPAVAVKRNPVPTD